MSVLSCNTSGGVTISSWLCLQIFLLSGCGQLRPIKVFRVASTLEQSLGLRSTVTSICKFTQTAQIKAPMRTSNAMTNYFYFASFTAKELITQMCCECLTQQTAFSFVNIKPIHSKYVFKAYCKCTCCFACAVFPLVLFMLPLFYSGLCRRWWVLMVWVVI